MDFFNLFVSFLISQRLIELIIAKRNERNMLSKGAIEIGHSHYKWLVFMHVTFFICFIVEVNHYSIGLSPYWKVLIMIFLILQCGRMWTILSLGPFWNTKIIVLPNTQPQISGPYKYIKHPNYLIVALEFVMIPAIFQAYMTMIIFSLWNIMMMKIRIPLEEQVLKDWMDYDRYFAIQQRFIPKIARKIKGNE